jgi:hypothetical protein
MKPMQRMAPLAALTALLLCACAGGSGSSGFDISPAAENAAIEQALADQACVDLGPLQICPSDVPLPAAEQVDTGLDRDTPLPCAQLDPSSACALQIPIAPLGFPPEAVFHLAARPLDGAAWQIGPAAVLGGPTSPANPVLDAPVDVPVSSAPNMSGQPIALQLAVLVYLTPPAELPAEVELLSDSGADFAFVTGTVLASPAGF